MTINSNSDVRNKKYPDSQFTQLKETDLEQVWHWRNQPAIRQNMHNSKTISWAEHQAWFEQLPQSGKVFYIFHQNNRAIGTLYFDTAGPGKLEWGCYVGETDVWPGSGLLLEIAALDYAAAQPHISHLHAEVLSFNQSVLKMHQLFGYQTCPDKPAISLKAASATASTSAAEPFCIKVFEYQTASWRAQRSSILARLPKQISAAADYIHFQD
ncbi:UDP-4-amino-4,6-dideoxy-N-acetyl-beta-L-altrosamine N-acetyltransferase [Arsukibacterium sp.]|uniref:UDP-4-amino-4, 6-dideoxy-N-acetyl-beta-L-altrosamine N-acetyltransferase n=1 Tax=Arsukibacterium sp. TaxID=1977258 RepID=UPI001BD64FD0|nr:UDP-4-amino-4,6-dideoxy-N-acetyl-beta-L-altrosamine N-acetyltransferase [Arsukibacterium sp.]